VGDGEMTGERGEAWIRANQAAFEALVEGRAAVIEVKPDSLDEEGNVCLGVLYLTGTDRAVQLLSP
jgi:hypothetical protein